MDDKPYPLLKATDIAAMQETRSVHQYNDNGIRHTKSISDKLGLKNIGVHLVRVEPGNDSTTFHLHHRDEEFLYILSGRGIAEIGDDRHEVGPGDFMAFGQHSLPHNLHNPFDEDLVYLMGGDRNDIDICDYPRMQRRQFRVDGKRQYVDMEHLHDVTTKK